MTAGEEALAEAARLEAARVYGQLCPEQQPDVDVTGLSRVPAIPAIDLEAARRRRKKSA